MFRMQIQVITAILKMTLKPRPSFLSFRMIIHRLIFPHRVYLAQIIIQRRLFRLSDIQDKYSYCSVLFADLGSEENISLQLYTFQADSLVTIEKACPYPNPLTISYNLLKSSRDPDKRVGSGGSNTQISNYNYLPTNSCQ